MRQHTIVHIVLIIMIVILHSYNILNKNSTSHTQTHTFSSRIVRIFPINRGDHIYYVKPFHQNEPKDARRLKCIRMKAHRKKMPQATFKRMRLSSLCVCCLCYCFWFVIIFPLVFLFLHSWFHVLVFVFVYDVFACAVAMILSQIKLNQTENQITLNFFRPSLVVCTNWAADERMSAYA